VAHATGHTVNSIDVTFATCQLGPEVPVNDHSEADRARRQLVTTCTGSISAVDTTRSPGDALVLNP